MANVIMHQDELHSQAARNLAIDMIQGMIDVLDDLDAARREDAETEREIDRHVLVAREIGISPVKSSPVVTKPRGWAARQAKLNPPTAALPLFYLETDNNMPVPEHRAIMVPDNDLEGMEAIVEHLGECRKPTTFKYKGKNGLHMHGGKGLTNLDKIIFYEAVTTAQGDPCLPHEDHSRRAWYRDASQIRSMFKTTVEQAETMKLAFEILDTTPAMAEKFKAWLSIPDKFESGFRYFENLAGEIVKVTDIGEPELNLALDEETNLPVSEDNPADIEMLPAVKYHLLDDPRDDYTPWEKRQPKDFQNILAKIRTSDLTQLKAVGKELFGEKRFSKTHMTVIWDEYHRRKNNLTPKLRPVATKILRRLADPDVNLAKAAAWLHGKGRTELTAHELSVVWEAWKRLKAARAPKQATLLN
jgi:hypothetical protein